MAKPKERMGWKRTALLAIAAGFGTFIASGSIKGTFGAVIGLFAGAYLIHFLRIKKYI